MKAPRVTESLMDALEVPERIREVIRNQREQIGALEAKLDRKALAALEDAAELTVRNQEVEILRLRRRIAELESK